MNSGRVPPSVTHAFKNHLLDICTVAALDDDERQDRLEEWQRQMELFWLNASERVDSLRAQEMAIASLGEPIKVGKRLRAPWWHRLLFHHRLRPMRFMLIIMAGVYVSYLQTMASMGIRVGPEGQILTIFFYAANSFLGGLCALMAWSSRAVYVERHPKLWVTVCMAATGIQLKILYHFVLVALFIGGGHWSTEVQLFFPLLLIGCFGLVLSGLSLLAELLDLPSHKPGSQEMNPTG